MQTPVVLRRSSGLIVWFLAALWVFQLALPAFAQVGVTATASLLGDASNPALASMDAVAESVPDAEPEEEENTIGSFSRAVNITSGTWSLPPLMDVTLPEGWKKALDIAAGINGGIWVMAKKKKLSDESRIWEWTHWDDGIPRWDSWGGIDNVERLAGGARGTCFGPVESRKEIRVFTGAERVPCSGNASVTEELRDLAVDPANVCWYIDRAGRLCSTGKAVPAGIPSDLVSLEFDASGSLWLLGGDKGIRCWEKGRLVTDLGSASAIACGGDGSLWSISPDGYVLRRREGMIWRDMGGFKLPVDRLAIDSRGCPWLIVGNRAFTTKQGMESGFAHAFVPGKKRKWPIADAFVTLFDWGAFEWECIWKDEGSGGKLDLCFRRVQLPTGWVRFGDYAAPSYDYPTGVGMLIAKDNPDQFKPPKGYRLIYKNEGSPAKKRVSIWEPIPPASNFRALGHVATCGDKPPSLDYVRCVRSDLVVRGSGIGPIYKDIGTHATMYCTIFTPDQMAGTLAANTFWASNKTEWKVERSEAEIYLIKAPPAKEYQEFREQFNRRLHYSEMVSKWNTWRDWLWKREELYRCEANRIRNEKLKELLEKATVSKTASEAVSVLPEIPAEDHSRTLHDYETFRKNNGGIHEAAVPPELVAKTAAWKDPQALSGDVGKTVDSLLNSPDAKDGLPIGQLKWLQGLEFAGAAPKLRDAKRLDVPPYIILTGKMSLGPLKETEAFVALYSGTGNVVGGCVCIFPQGRIKIGDAALKSISFHDWFDSCITLNRAAIILATDDGVLNGSLFESALPKVDTKGVLAPGAKSAWKVALKRGRNLFSVAALTKDGPLGCLAKLPGWPEMTWWQGLLASEPSGNNLLGVASMTPPSDWLVRPESFSIGVTGKPAVSLGITLKTSIAGKTVTFLCTMDKDLDKEKSLSGISLRGSAVCGHQDCKPPCGHLRIPFVGLSISKLLLTYAQKANAAGVPETTIGLGGILSIGKRQIDIAGRLPLPPAFANAAVRGKTNLAFGFNDLLQLAASQIPGLDEKIVKAVGEFGLEPIDQKVVKEDGAVATESIIAVSVAGQKDTFLDISKGITLKGGLVLGGLKLGAIDLQIDEKGMNGAAMLNPIDLGGIMTLSGREKNSGPRIRLVLCEKSQEAAIEARLHIKLLKLANVDLDFHVKPSGLVGLFEAKVFDSFSAGLLVKAQPSLTAPNIGVAIKLGTDFIGQLSDKILGTLTGSIFGGLRPFDIKEALVQGDLKSATEADLKLAVRLAIMGVSKEVTIGSFDLEHPEATLEKAARHLAELILDKGTDLVIEAGKCVIAGAAKINETVVKGLESFAKKTGVGFAGAKKELDGFVGDLGKKAASQVSYGLKAGESVGKASVSLMSEAAKKVEKVMSDAWKELEKAGKKVWELVH